MLLIAVEGVDCSGKTSLINRLVKEYPERFEKICFPDRTTKTGKIIDKFLQGNLHYDKQKMHELFHLNRIECQEKIKKILKHKNVICDRYITSGVVYAKADNVKPFCDPDKILLPDVQIYLDVDIEVISARKGFGKEKFEKEKFQIQVKKFFEEDPGWSKWLKINANLPFNEVYENFKSAIEDLNLSEE